MVRSVSKNKYIRQFFNKITPIYPALEKGLYWGRADKWRAAAVTAAKLDKPKRVLDACCGTGQLAILLAQQLGPSCHVIGVDLSPAMVNAAKNKIRALHLHRRVEVKTENAEILPFPENFFDAVFLGFGLRFVSDIRTVFKECYRVIRPGGSIILLELARPKNPVMRLLTHVLREYWFPLWARLKFGLPAPMAHHLHDSLVHFPDPEKMGRMLVRVGYDNVEYQDLGLGVASMHRARKPEEEE